MTSPNMQEAREINTAEDLNDYLKIVAPSLSSFERNFCAYKVFDKIALALSKAEARGRLAGLEEAIKDVEAEPELPGDMPDEMWYAIRNDRDACQESHKITVRGTKKNIVEAIRSRQRSSK